jgi:hypothetical protein
VHSLSSRFDNQVTTIDVSELRRQFESTHPFLRNVLKSEQTPSSESTDFPNANSAEPDSDDRAGGITIDQAVNDLKNLLQLHVHWAVVRLRTFLFLSFLLVQCIVFAVTGYGAHRDIRPRS